MRSTRKMAAMLTSAATTTRVWIEENLDSLIEVNKKI
jgi:hypothetical protein